jgi:hypothetical protein
VPDWVEVGCYAGGRGDETPRVVLLGGREVTLRVERRWIEEPVGSTGGERRRMFQIRLGDGRRCRLAQEPGRFVDAWAHGRWSLTIQAGSVPGAVRRMVGHGLWLVVRRLPKHAEARHRVEFSVHRT